MFAFSDPPNPRVGEDVNVTYVARNDGPDAVTGLKLYTREDSAAGYRSYCRCESPASAVPGPFVFGDVLPVGAYTYLMFRYSVKAAGDLTNYFTVEYQDQLIPNAEDHPELTLPIKTLPADVGLSRQRPHPGPDQLRAGFSAAYRCGNRPLAERQRRRYRPVRDGDSE